MLFLAVPAIEIYFILKIGALLGVWATLAIIAVTAVVGAALAKSQGLAVLRKLTESISAGQGTGTAIVEGVLLLAAGITLLAPGFLTDAIGLALLIPPVRQALAARLAKHWRLTTIVGASPFNQDHNEPPPPGVIDV